MENFSLLSENGNPQALLDYTFLSLLVFSCLELWLPLLQPKKLFLRRWLVNFSLYILSLVIIGLIAALASTYFPIFPDRSSIGFYFYIELPFFLKIILCVLILDMLDYWQHRLFHHWTFFWRAHLTHHSDLDIDSSTTLRHHPLEFLLSTIINIIVTTVLGAPLIILFIYNRIVLLFDFFSHANLRIHPLLNKLLATILITPDIHRIHHASDRRLSNSNYGKIFNLWDRLFGTYVTKSRQYQRQMEFGLRYFRSPDEQTIIGCLKHAFSYRKSFTDSAYM